MAGYAQLGARVPRVLYFITGPMPTDEQIKDIARFGPNAVFRNSMGVAPVAMSALEECDAVTGDVPERYAAAYPNASDFDGSTVMTRMSDYDRRHGPVHSVDNERARAAKPPAFGQDTVMAQGAPRPAGATTVSGGGFLAPAPGNPDNLPMSGSERAENGPEGANTEGRQGGRLNPQALPDRGVTLLPEGVEGTSTTGPTADGGGVAGFTAPKPADDTEAEAEDTASSKSKRGAKGSTGDTGATG